MTVCSSGELCLSSWRHAARAARISIMAAPGRRQFPLPGRDGLDTQPLLVAAVVGRSHLDMCMHHGHHGYISWLSLWKQARLRPARSSGCVMETGMAGCPAQARRADTTASGLSHRSAYRQQGLHRPDAHPEQEAAGLRCAGHSGPRHAAPGPGRQLPRMARGKQKGFSRLSS